MLCLSKLDFQTFMKNSPKAKVFFNNCLFSMLACGENMFACLGCPNNLNQLHNLCFCLLSSMHVIVQSGLLISVCFISCVSFLFSPSFLKLFACNPCVYYFMPRCCLHYCILSVPKNYLRS